MNPLKAIFVRALPPEDYLLTVPLNSLQAEALELLAMSDDLAEKNPGLGECFNEWRNTVKDLLQEPIEEGLATERRLEKISMEFR